MRKRERGFLPLPSAGAFLLPVLGIWLLLGAGAPWEGQSGAPAVRAAAAGSVLENAKDDRGRLLIPYGSPIPDDGLDGNINEAEEWADANRIDVTIVEEESGRSYEARLWLKHTGEFLYFAFATPMRPAVAFWLLLYLDRNGNGSVFDPGDDVVRVPAKKFHKIPESKSAEDLYVKDVRRGRPFLERDTADGGERNIVGKGRERRGAHGVSYTAEGRHPLNSGDGYDVAWKPGDTVYLYLEGIWPVPAEGVEPDIYKGGNPRQATAYVLMPSGE